MVEPPRLSVDPVASRLFLLVDHRYVCGVRMGTLSELTAVPQQEEDEGSVYDLLHRTCRANPEKASNMVEPPRLSVDPVASRLFLLVDHRS
jgi:hypothetical protein